MDTQVVAPVVEQCTVRVRAQFGDSRIQGSGVVISASGLVLTANHVVSKSGYHCDTVCVRHKNTDPVPYRVVRADAEIDAVAKTALNRTTDVYRVVTGGEIIAPAGLKDPIRIDLALLAPQKRQQNQRYLEIADYAVSLGQQVVIAGFPDRMRMPLRIPQALAKLEVPLDQVDDLTSLPMISSAMVGQVFPVRLRAENASDSCEGEVLYVDNALHSGASGGPVVDEKCRVVGILTSMGLTTVQSGPLITNAPSGINIAISPRILSATINACIEEF